MEEDIIIDMGGGDYRNAVVVRGGPGQPRYGAMPPMVRPQPPAFRPTALPVKGYAPAPQVIYQQAPPAPAASIKSWIPDIVDVAAALSPLPVAPTATGDVAKDFANAMTYAGALAASLKRADLLHTVARIAERRL